MVIAMHRHGCAFRLARRRWLENRQMTRIHWRHLTRPAKADQAADQPRTAASHSDSKAGHGRTLRAVRISTDPTPHRRCTGCPPPSGSRTPEPVRPIAAKAHLARHCPRRLRCRRRLPVGHRPHCRGHGQDQAEAKSNENLDSFPAGRNVGSCHRVWGGVHETGHYRPASMAATPPTSTPQTRVAAPPGTPLEPSYGPVPTGSQPGGQDPACHRAGRDGMVAGMVERIESSPRR